MRARGPICVPARNCRFTRLTCPPLVHRSLIRSCRCSCRFRLLSDRGAPARSKSRARPAATQHTALRDQTHKCTPGTRPRHKRARGAPRPPPPRTIAPSPRTARAPSLCPTPALNPCPTVRTQVIVVIGQKLPKSKGKKAAPAAKAKASPKASPKPAAAATPKRRRRARRGRRALRRRPRRGVRASASPRRRRARSEAGPPQARRPYRDTIIVTLLRYGRLNAALATLRLEVADADARRA